MIPKRTKLEDWSQLSTVEDEHGVQWVERKSERGVERLGFALDGKINVEVSLEDGQGNISFLLSPHRDEGGDEATRKSAWGKQNWRWIVLGLAVDGKFQIDMNHPDGVGLTANDSTTFIIPGRTTTSYIFSMFNDDSEYYLLFERRIPN